MNKTRRWMLNILGMCFGGSAIAQQQQTSPTPQIPHTPQRSMNSLDPKQPGKPVKDPVLWLDIPKIKKEGGLITGLRGYSADGRTIWWIGADGVRKEAKSVLYPYGYVTQ
jgi:hypothetical protein